MGLLFGNLLGAVALATTAASSSKSLKGFLDSFDNYGILVTNNFEANFSGLTDMTFYILSVSLPGLELITTEISYDGKKVEVPVNYDWQHDCSMTIINDALGYIYSALANFFMTESSSILADSGYTMTLKALTGNDKYKGTLFTLFGVKLVTIGNLEYSYSGQEILTFTVSMKCNYFTVTPGALGTAANIIGAVNSLIS